MRALVVGGGVVGCGAVAVPTVRFLLAPARGGSDSGRWIRALRLDALAIGEPKRVTLIADHGDAWTLEKAVELGAVWLTRVGGSEVRAWSVTCPHLGCAIDRAATAPDGRRQTGPSPRDLDALATRIEDGVVFVEFRRFQMGMPAKVTIG